MKKTLFITLLIAGTIASGFAQKQFDGEPLSKKMFLSENNVPTINLIAPEKLSLEAEDQQINMRERIGVVLPVGATFNDGLVNQTSLNQIVWRMHVSVKSAKAVGLYFSSFEIPAGGKVYVYNQTSREILGAFTQASNPLNEEFAIRYLIGDELTIEYNGPLGEKPVIDLAEVGYFYRNIPEAKEKQSRDFGDSQACQVNVNCPEGNGKEDIRDASVRILVKDGGGFFWCSGTMMANTGGGCVPYLLSADHCASTSNSSDFNQFLFYFNYQSPDCNNPNSDFGLDNQTLTGCSKKASSTTQGDQDSDFLLVELNDTIPSFYDVFYAGWDISGGVSGNGVSIHHPSGDLKKISSYNSNLISDSWQGIVNHTHWRVNWASSASGHGVTEGGSSGSGIFDASNHLIGTLTGGSSSCSGTSFPDYYGKFYHSWSQVGSQANRRLDVWLDPLDWDATNTNLVVDGVRFPCAVVKTSVSSLSKEKELLFSVGLNPSPNGSIQLNSLVAGSTISILNGIGQLVFENTVSHSNVVVPNLNAGWYLIKAQHNGNQQVEQVIVTE